MPRVTVASCIHEIRHHDYIPAARLQRQATYLLRRFGRFSGRKPRSFARSECTTSRR